MHEDRKPQVSQEYANHIAAKCNDLNGSRDGICKRSGEAKTRLVPFTGSAESRTFVPNQPIQ